MARKMVEGRLFIGRRKGRHRFRWMDDVVLDPKLMKIKQLMKKMKDREKWRLIFEGAKAHPGLQRQEEGSVADARMYLATMLTNPWQAVSPLHSFQISAPPKLYYNFKIRFLFLTYNLIYHTFKI